MSARAVGAVAALLPLLAAARLGVDVSEPVDLAAAQCLKAGGVSFAIARAWESIDHFDKSSVTTLASLRGAGIVDAGVYLFPCSFGADPAYQIKAMLGNLSAAGAQFNRVWLDIETNPDPACAWKADKAANCAWLKSLIAAVNATGVPLGVYTSIHEYETWMSDTPQGCVLNPGGASTSIPLWYPHYESPPNPSFSDFKPFGGWTTPTIKQFFDSTSGTGIPNCKGAPGVDANWRP